MPVDQTRDHEASRGIDDLVDRALIGFSDEGDFIAFENDLATFQDLVSFTLPGQHRAVPDCRPHR